jgi:hypothetical protein
VNLSVGKIDVAAVDDDDDAAEVDAPLDSLALFSSASLIASSSAIRFDSSIAFASSSGLPVNLKI